MERQGTKEEVALNAGKIHKSMQEEKNGTPATKILEDVLAMKKDVALSTGKIRKLVQEEGTPDEEEQPIRWRKTGGGSFRMANGKIIKRNQVFQATIDQIPKAFRDVVIPVDDLPERQPLQVAKTSYTIQSGSPGWYNVIDGQGKVINEKGLRQAAAQELIGSLSQ